MAHKGRNWPYLFRRDLTWSRTSTFQYCCYAKQYSLYIFDAVGPFLLWYHTRTYSNEGTVDEDTGTITYRWEAPPGATPGQSIEARISLTHDILFNQIRWVTLIGSTVHKITPATPNLIGRNPEQLESWALGDGFAHVDFIVGSDITPKRYY